MIATKTRDGARDFDFWMGSWKVHNRVLKERLAGSTEWVEFEALSIARPLLDGLGNEDEFRTDHDGGFIGMSFRFYDPQKDQWAIYWADTRRPGFLDAPVFGSFSGDVGIFEGDDTFEGRPIRMRFIWSGDHDSDPAVGAGLLGGRRRDLGDELDHGLHAARRLISRTGRARSICA